MYFSLLKNFNFKKITPENLIKKLQNSIKVHQKLLSISFQNNLNFYNNKTPHITLTRITKKNCNKLSEHMLRYTASI